MSDLDAETGLPATIRIPTDAGEAVFRLDASRHARRAAVAAIDVPLGELELRDGPPGEDDAGLPVYRAGPDGPPAVATGWIHVRVGRDASLSARAGELRELGFEIREVHAYAPFAGWVEAHSGGVRFALAHWTSILALDGVEHAEPQLLRPAERRDRGP